MFVVCDAGAGFSGMRFDRGHAKHMYEPPQALKVLDTGDIPGAAAEELHPLGTEPPSNVPMALLLAMSLYPTASVPGPSLYPLNMVSM